MCYLTYGSYTHATGSVGLTSSWKTLYTDAQTPWGQEVTINLQGLLTTQLTTEAAAIADIKSKMDALWAAYLVPDQDLILYNPSGGVTHHNYPTSNAIGGVRVISMPSFGDPKGVELVTKASWTATLQAVYALASPVTAIQSFEETIQFEGGGWRVGHLETKIGPPVKQLLRVQTPYRATQRGSAVGKYAYPTRPNPVWPTEVLQPNPVITYGQPKRNRSDYTDYPISWSWSFESATPLIGTPHLWGYSWGT